MMEFRSSTVSAGDGSPNNLGKECVYCKAKSFGAVKY